MKICRSKKKKYQQKWIAYIAKGYPKIPILQFFTLFKRGGGVKQFGDIPFTPYTFLEQMGYYANAYIILNIAIWCDGGLHTPETAMPFGAHAVLKKSTTIKLSENSSHSTMYYVNSC